ncbi:MAG TPA: ComF family protein [Castellaniella sp.]|nr:ComF family protein [Castellaniella sp.]
MLDTAGWREYLDPRRVLREGVARLPGDCPRCSARSRGARPCSACCPTLIATMNAPRCTVCAHPLQAGSCPDCTQHKPAFERVIAAFDYEGAGRDLVLLYKARRWFYLSGALGDLLAQAIAASPQALHRSTILVPVPARREAMLRRGFNPAAELARVISRRMGLPCQPAWLDRVADGSKQAMLGRSARRAALDGVYSCRPVPAACHVAVVDDVLTTGSTLDVIARAFKAQGAASVTGLVLARATQRNV